MQEVLHVFTFFLYFILFICSVSALSNENFTSTRSHFSIIFLPIKHVFEHFLLENVGRILIMFLLRGSFRNIVFKKEFF